MSDDTIYELSDETLALLKKRRPRNGIGCFLCRLIVLDHEKHGFLTGYPKNHGGENQFPVDGKLAHITLEKQSAETQAANVAEEKAAKKPSKAAKTPKEAGPQV